MHTSRGRYTHTGRQDAGGGFVKVESAHAPHAVGDERQHVAAKQEASVKKQAAERHVSESRGGLTFLLPSTR